MVLKKLVDKKNVHVFFFFRQKHNRGGIERTAQDVWVKNFSAQRAGKACLFLDNMKLEPKRF